MSSPPKRRSRSHPRKSYQPRRPPSPSPPDFQDVLEYFNGQLLASFSASLASLKTGLDQVSQQTAQLSRMFSYIANRYGSVSTGSYVKGGFLPAGMNWVTAPKGSAAVTATDGFSADELPLTIGSYLGVRYWRVPKTYGPEGSVTIAQSSPLWVPVGEYYANQYYANPELPPGKNLHLEGMWGAWSAGENTAHCRPAGCADERVPGRACSCGFWAYWETQEASRHMSDPDVVGVIEGYGHVIAGSAGFRCSKARVAALCVLPAGPAWRNSVMTRLHETYGGVPIYPDPDTMMRAHPPTRGRVAEWAAKRPEDAAAAREYALPFPLVTGAPPAIPARIPCVICGELAPGGAVCEHCSELAALATRYSVRFTCNCGAVREVTLETLQVAKGSVRYRCHCGVEMMLEPPKLTPQQALAELKRRAGNWTVH